MSGWVLGLDEVGRGALAGPLVVAGVLVRDPSEGGPPVQGVADSKVLSPRKREEVSTRLLASPLVRRAFAERSPAFLDEHGMTRALGECFRDCIGTLLTGMGEEGLVEVRIDGEALWDPAWLTHPWGCPVSYIVKGDATDWAIGAASVIAKVHRDRGMVDAHQGYPVYGFDQHKGYGTRQHEEAIRNHGLTAIHRRSFCKKFLRAA